MTGFRGNLKLNSFNSQGEVHPGGDMKKEYTIRFKTDETDDICEMEEYMDEEELIFTIDNKDVICPQEMSEMISKLDNNILGLA